MTAATSTSAPASGDDGVAWCCILSGGYHPQLSAFLESLRAHVPEASCTVFMIGPTDPPSPRLRSLAEFLDITPALSLGFQPGAPGAPTWGNVSMQAKPCVLAYMLASHRHVVYADADLWLLEKPSTLLAAVREASIVLTPHLVVAAQSPRGMRNDLKVLHAGTFNAGIVGVSADEGGRAFCPWWAKRTLAMADRLDGRPCDQRWLNLVPHLFRNVSMLDDPGVNVGHWRIESHADVQRTPNGYALLGHPISILHMSGFDQGMPAQWSRHAPGLVASEGTALRELADRYAACVARAA